MLFDNFFHPCAALYEQLVLKKSLQSEIITAEAIIIIIVFFLKVNRKSVIGSLNHITISLFLNVFYLGGTNIMHAFVQ